MEVSKVSPTLQPHPPFLPAQPTAQPKNTALLHLRRDNIVPVRLEPHSPNTADTTGYAEGNVTNTRFGSYPHSTLLDVPWGSQVRASVVDTGSRGQKKRQLKAQAVKQEQEPQQEQQEEPQQTPTKLEDDTAQAIDVHPISPRKRTASEPAPLQPPPKKQQTAPNATKSAPTGFAHLLPLTPEGWTLSLPHRTQVVYTPDYSYIIQRLRIRPGSRVIEAGAGSGSFTHAAARAVYNGKIGDGAGKVFSYEYHEPRAEQLRREVQEHGMSGLVTVTHRDVYKEGFLVPSLPTQNELKPEEDGQADPAADTAPATNNTEVPDKGGRPTASARITQTNDTTPLRRPPITPNATSIFLDLPDPSQALRHLTRSSPSTPLHPAQPIHLCGFLPCIEQVTTFIAALRSHSFVEISMSELMHRRLEVRRERIGLDLEGLRGVNATAANVTESVERLKEVQKRDRDFREANTLPTRKELVAMIRAQRGENGGAADVKKEEEEEEEDQERAPAETRAERLKRIQLQQKERKWWKEGRLVCRTEPEVKSHTSYLVFAVLPREWSEEDESRARERWSGAEAVKGRKSKKQLKRERKAEERRVNDERRAREEGEGCEKGEEVKEELGDEKGGEVKKQVGDAAVEVADATS